ncbi:MAG: TIR domain-containing protein [Ruminococcaceae bacterium]|nr:TIR domain-containing protein [Oscillospiraceae bacterium]
MHDVFVSFSFADQEISQYVVNRLLSEYNIPCWICTSEILAGEHYKEVIVDAIAIAKIVLLIQSEHSIGSKEVPKEIALALDKNKIVIPFVIDYAELTGDLEYDLLAVHRVDATKPTMDERIEELSRQIYAVLAKNGAENPWSRNFRGYSLISTPTVIPKKVFCGRDAVLDEISQNFQNGENVQFLYGVGGIGKTQIAKQYAKRHQNDYDTVIFATYNGSLKDMVIAENPFALEPELVRYTMSDGSKESDDAFFARKMEKIRKIANERTLIVIDNFDVEQDEALGDLIQGNYHLLITTRTDFSRHYPTVKIDVLEDMDDLKEIFMQNYDGYDVEEDDPKLEELIELVNRHTYTVELLAQHMENSGQTPEEMLAALKREGIRSLSEEVVGENMVKAAAYENLLKMFKLFTLTEEERRVLMYLSLMPTEGVNVRNFRAWADLDSTKLIKDLETRSWLLKNTEGIALHPIIKEVVRHEIPATEENCAEFLSRFTDSIEDKKTYGMKKSEKDRYALIAKELLKQFDNITETNAMFYYHAESLLSFAVDTECAVQLAKRLYEFFRSSKGEQSFETARSAFKLGWVYSFDSHLENSVENAFYWLKTADEIFGQVELVGSDAKSRHTMTKTNLSKQYLMKYRETGDKSDYETAKEYAYASIDHAAKSFAPDDFHHAKLGGAHMQLAEILLDGEQFEESLMHTETAVEILLSLFDETHVDIMLAYFLKSAALFGLGDFDKAKDYAKKSADGYCNYFGEHHPRNYQLFTHLGECCSKLGERAEALEAYERALKIAEKMYEPDAVQIIAAKEKITALKGA